MLHLVRVHGRRILRMPRRLKTHALNLSDELRALSCMRRTLAGLLLTLSRALSRTLSRALAGKPLALAGMPLALTLTLAGMPLALTLTLSRALAGMLLALAGMLLALDARSLSLDARSLSLGDHATMDRRRELSAGELGSSACSESLPDKTPKRVQSKAWDGCRALRARGELITHRNEDFQLQVLEELILRMRQWQGFLSVSLAFRGSGRGGADSPMREGLGSAGADWGTAPGRRWAGLKNSPADPPFLFFLRFRTSPSLTCHIGRVRRRNGHVRSYLTVPVTPS